MRSLRNLRGGHTGKRSTRAPRAATVAVALVLAVSAGSAAASGSASAVTQIKSVYRAVLSAEYFGPASELCSHLTASGVKSFTSFGAPHTCVAAFDQLRHGLTHKIPDEDNSGYTPAQWRGLVVEILDHLKVSVHGKKATTIGGESGIPGQSDLVEVNGHWLFNGYPPSVAS